MKYVAILLSIFASISVVPAKAGLVTQYFSCGEILNLMNEGELEEVLLQDAETKSELLLVLVEQGILYGPAHSAAALKFLEAKFSSQLVEKKPEDRPAALFEFARNFKTTFERSSELEKQKYAEEIYKRLRDRIAELDYITEGSSLHRLVASRTMDSLEKLTAKRTQTLELIKEGFADYLDAFSQVPIDIMRSDLLAKKRDLQDGARFTLFSNRVLDLMHPYIVLTVFAAIANGLYIDSIHNPTLFHLWPTAIPTALMLTANTVHHLKSLKARLALAFVERRIKSGVNDKRTKFFDNLALASASRADYIKNQILNSFPFTLTLPKTSGIELDQKVLDGFNHKLAEGRGKIPETPDPAGNEYFFTLSARGIQDWGQQEIRMMAYEYNLTKDRTKSASITEGLRKLTELAEKIGDKATLYDRVDFHEELTKQIEELNNFSRLSVHTSKDRFSQHLGKLRSNIREAKSFLAKYKFPQESRQKHQISLLEPRVMYLEDFEKYAQALLDKWKLFSKHVQPTLTVLVGLKNKIPSEPALWPQFAKEVRDAYLVSLGMQSEIGTEP